MKLGTREPQSDKVKNWQAEAGPRATAGSFAEAAAFGELVIVATLWSGTENALRLAEAKHLSGKVVIDATNTLVYVPNAPPRLAYGHTDSGGEQVQR